MRKTYIKYTEDINMSQWCDYFDEKFLWENDYF